MGLKSAYELASQRVIKTRYKKPQKEPIIEFVNDFEYPGEKSTKNEFSEAFINCKNGEPLNKESGEIMPIDTISQEAESVSYDGKVREAYWSGHFFDYGGFARMNRSMAFGLSNRNVRVKLEIQPYLNHVNQATMDELERMANIDIAEDAPKIFGVTVPLNLAHAGKKIIYTMIESSDKVHPDYAGKLNLSDEIWVATEYGKKILQNSNVYPPIYVMPLGVDVSRYTPDVGYMDFGQSMKAFKFLSVFRWSYRKGYDLLLRAYLKEFSAKDDVSLLLVSRPVNTLEVNGSQRIVEDFTAIKDSIGKTENEFPHVALYTKPIKERLMPTVYNACQAFTLISRGEGFGIPYCEAAAVGLPVIASNCSGHSDFLTNENSYLVDPEGYSQAKIAGNMSRMAKLCRFYEDQMFPEFGHKSIEQIKAHMRDVYENYDKAKEKAAKLRSRIVNNYTWDMSIDRVYNRLKEIS